MFSLLVASALLAAPPEVPTLPARLQADWERPKAPLFSARGPSADDVFQGRLEDCALLANLAALAEQRPQLVAGLLRAEPDGRLAIRLPGGAWLNFDPALPTQGGRLLFAGDGPADHLAPGLRKPLALSVSPLWPAEIERAFASWHGGYAGLNEEIFAPLTELLGWQHRGIWLPKLDVDAMLATVSEAMGRKFVLVLGNADPKLAAEHGLRAGHGYAVLALRTDAHGGAWLLLRNPLGAVQAPQVGTGRPGTFEMDAREALRVFRHLSISGEDLSQLRALPSPAPHTDP